MWQTHTHTATRAAGLSSTTGTAVAGEDTDIPSMAGASLHLCAQPQVPVPCVLKHQLSWGGPHTTWQDPSLSVMAHESSRGRINHTSAGLETSVPPCSVRKESQDHLGCWLSVCLSEQSGPRDASGSTVSSRVNVASAGGFSSLSWHGLYLVSEKVFTKRRCTA